MISKWLFVLPVLLALGACDDKPATDQGFAGMGSQAEGYAPVIPGRTFGFPADHGPHPGFRIEWWYVTANLQDADGQRFGVQWTLFRNALWPGPAVAGWHDPNQWMGHAALTSASVHYAEQRLGRGGIGQAGVNPAPFTAWIDDWSLASETAAGSPADPLAADPLSRLHLKARGQHFDYDLRLATDQPLVLQGRQGYSIKSGQGQASYYYSQPFFTVEGQVQVDGQAHAVTGKAWLDREWSSQALAPGQSGWDWFSLHLRDGTRLMLYRIREATQQSSLSGSWIHPDGQVEALEPGQVMLRPLQHTSVAGRRLPSSWSIEIPSRQLAITTQALNPKAWMDLDVPYWEGPVTVSGSQDGVGYVEMTGY